MVGARNCSPNLTHFCSDVSNSFASTTTTVETTTEADDGRVSVGTVFFAVPANQVPEEFLEVGERVNVTGFNSVSLNQNSGRQQSSRGGSNNNRRTNNRRQTIRTNQTIRRGVVPQDDPGVSTIRPVPVNLRNRNTIRNNNRNSQNQREEDNFSDYEDTLNSVFGSLRRRPADQNLGPVRVRYT